MSFACAYSDSAELERRHARSGLSAELVYPYTRQVTRQDWPLLLDRSTRSSERVRGSELAGDSPPSCTRRNSPLVRSTSNANIQDDII